MVGPNALAIVNGNRGDDDLLLEDGGSIVSLGAGDDSLLAEGYVGFVNAGRGNDYVRLEALDHIRKAWRGTSEHSIASWIFLRCMLGSDTAPNDVGEKFSTYAFASSEHSDGMR